MRPAYGIRINDRSSYPGRRQQKDGTPARTRTVDKLIKSQLLYQLSYGGL